MFNTFDQLVIRSWKIVLQGLAAVKDPAAKECYIAAIQSSDETAHDLKRNMGMVISLLLKGALCLK